MRDLFMRKDIVCHEQTGRERGLSTYRDVHQGALGKLYRVGGGQHQRGAVLLEDDQPHPVAALTVNEKKWRVKSSMLANLFFQRYFKELKSEDNLASYSRGPARDSH